MPSSHFPSRPVAFVASLVALSLGVGVAVAQTPAAPPAAAQATPAPAHPHHVRMTLAEHFAKANTTNDGHLTLEQAKAGMPSVARHFAAIDKDGKGYVTLADIHTYLKAERAARRQAKAKANAGTSG